MSEQDVVPINGALLRRQREARGWSLSDVATRACMSIKQIRQIEDGGVSAFYSEAVKQTAARKVGAILGVSSEAVFGVDVPTTQDMTELSCVTSHEADELLALSDPDASPADAQPVQAFHESAPEAAASAVLPSSDASDEAPSAPGRMQNSWGLIAVLFVGAIALAATLRPSQQEPVAATEAPPALAPALQGDPVEPAASSAASSTDIHVVAPVEAVAVTAPAPAASQTAPAPAGVTSAAKSN